MKRALLLFLTVPALSLSALTPTFSTYETAHYRVLSQMGDEHARETALKLEALAELFNEHFRFDPGDLPGRMRARFFASRERYDEYLDRTIGGSRDEVVYVHYGDVRRSELVGFCADPDSCGPSFDILLPHQAFVQFLRAFIPNPPLWLREGFAAYFERVRSEGDTGTPVYRENLAWLDTLQSILSRTSGAQPIPLRRLVLMDLSEARSRPELFHPQAWGLVSFLVNSPDGNTNRILWDSISALDPASTLLENSRNVWHRAFRWHSEEQLTDSYVTYVKGRKSFRSLVEIGIARYEAGDADAARSAFAASVDLHDDHSVPYYYLGLIAFEDGDHAAAEDFFSTALARGSAVPLTRYALGVNAYTDGRLGDARRHLEQAAVLDHDEYGPKARQLLERIDR